MLINSGVLRKSVMGLPLKEATFLHRGFQSRNHQAQQRLEQIGKLVLQAYNIALEERDVTTVAERLDMIERENRGFAYEGAAMGLMMLDCLTPWQQNRWQQFLVGPGQAYIHLVHIGAGLALGFLRRRLAKPLARMDPFLRWLVPDGYGFLDGYLRTKATFHHHTVPAKLDNYERRVFDHGLGRSLWFVAGADVQQTAVTIAAFPPSRQADLWSGVGLACAYAGGVSRAEIGQLVDLAHRYRSALAVGVTYAARARCHSQNLAESTEAACQIICHMSTAEADAVTHHVEKDLPPDGDMPAWEVWRQRIQAHFS